MGTRSDYVQAHKRLGRADAHKCTICGAQAQEWAFTYACPNPQYVNTEGMSPYCLHPEHYTTLCRSCHQKFDRQHDPLAQEKLARRTAAIVDSVRGNVKVNSMKASCSCGMESTPGPLAHHKNRMGHQ